MLLVSSELDEVLALADRSRVMYRGPHRRDPASAEADAARSVGLLMAGELLRRASDQTHVKELVLSRRLARALVLATRDGAMSSGGSSSCSSNPDTLRCVGLVHQQPGQGPQRRGNSSTTPTTRSSRARFGSTSGISETLVDRHTADPRRAVGGARLPGRAVQHRGGASS